MKVRASRCSMVWKAREKPRTPVSDPTPAATARITKMKSAGGRARFAPGDFGGGAVRARLTHALTYACVTASGLIAHDKTIAQGDDAVRMGGERGIVGHHHQRRAFATVEFEQQFENLLAGLAIEIAGGFIGEQDGRPGDESAGERDTLLFAARELDRIVVEAVRETYAGQQFAGARR